MVPDFIYYILFNFFTIFIFFLVIGYLLMHFVKMKYLGFLLLIFVLIFIISCSDDSVSPVKEPERGELVSTTFLREYSIDELKAIASLFGYTIEPKSSVNAYKIEYISESTSKGVLTASGLLLIPQNNDKKYITSVQHATAFKKDEGAMSSLNTYFFQGLVPIFENHIVIMPDYFGYGSTENMSHPYHHYQNTANACVDMILSSITALNNLKVNYQDSINLMGYSEGGYATIATQKEIESRYSDKIKLKMAIAGSGAYNLYETAKYYFNSDTLVTPSFIPFMLNAYISETKDGRKIEDFFQPIYHEAVRKIITGTISKISSNKLLSNIPKDLMDSTFYYNFINDKPEETKIKTFLIENSLINFQPKSFMILYHGGYDLDVPVSNTNEAYNYYIRNNNTIKLIIDNFILAHDQYFFEFIDRAREYLR